MPMHQPRVAPTRFLARDPLSKEALRQDTYVYVNNRPTNDTDPFGLTPGKGCDSAQQQMFENAIDAGCSCIDYALDALQNDPDLWIPPSLGKRSCIEATLAKMSSRCKNNRPHVHCTCQCPPTALGVGTSCFFGLGNHITFCTSNPNGPLSSWGTRVSVAIHEMAHCSGAWDPPFGPGCDAIGVEMLVDRLCPVYQD